MQDFFIKAKFLLISFCVFVYKPLFLHHLCRPPPPPPWVRTADFQFRSGGFPCHDAIERRHPFGQYRAEIECRRPWKYQTGRYSVFSHSWGYNRLGCFKNN